MVDNKYKYLLVGLEKLFKFDPYLTYEFNIHCGSLCDEYKINSLIAFCNTGKFLDQI